MNAPQLFGGALTLAIALSGCHRPASKAEVQQTASDTAAKVKVESAKAREQLADAWLTTKIQSKFVGDREIKATDINVSSHDGVVTLKGRVLNDPMRKLAVAIAQNTDGVRQVVDQLNVEIAPPVAARAQNAATPGAVPTTGAADNTARPATVSASDDARITSSIQSKYFMDERIKGRHIKVATDGGIVTLNGEVGDETERAEALLLARTTEGVKRVEDSLTVTAGQPSAATSTVAPPTAAAPAPAGDEALAARISSQLSSDTQIKIKGAPLDVSAKNGVVLLQGTVTTNAAKRRALTVARGTDGVTQVVDRIRVGRAKK
jgi:hyperosmotically inducible protein